MNNNNNNVNNKIIWIVITLIFQKKKIVSTATFNEWSCSDIKVDTNDSAVKVTCKKYVLNICNKLEYKPEQKICVGQ